MHDPLRSTGQRRDARRNDDMAAALLDVVNEAELEEFLGGLVAEAASNAGRRVPGETGKPLVAALRRTAQRTLPTLRMAFGEVRLPGRTAAENAQRVFGLELEGMSAEDRDFEIARQFVRFARTAARAATAAAPHPTTVGDAIARAAREHAPGLVPPTRGAATGS